jgi:hypothetical protein
LQCVRTYVRTARARRACSLQLAKGTDRTPGRAAAVYNDIKVATYGDQSNFVPLTVETGKRINAAGLEFFDTVSGALEGDTAKVRAARRAELYGVADALVRHQGYMLAQIDRRGDPRALQRPISRWGMWVVRGWLRAVTMREIFVGLATTTTLMMPICLIAFN